MCGSGLMTSSDVIGRNKEGSYRSGKEGLLLVHRVWSLVVPEGLKRATVSIVRRRV